MDKKWIITGASSGIGRALTQSALTAGDSVVGLMRRPERAAALVAEFSETFTATAFDVRDTDRAAEIVAAAVERLGGIDVLVNNGRVGQIGSAEEVSDRELRDMLAQHLFGPAALVRAVLPYMREERSGTIVQLSSQGGRISFPGAGAYSAGKFALEGWSEALAGEVSPFGIRVMIVEPSRFRTEFNDPAVLKMAESSSAYEPLLGASRADMVDSGGRQEGDPVRAAAIIHRLIDGETLPLRLPLGAEAVVRIGNGYRAGLSGLDAMADISRSADFPDAPASVRPV